MSVKVDYNAYTLERFLIPPEFLTEKMIEIFPEDIQRELRSGSYPLGIGVHCDLGWYCVCAGQGPALIWAERMEDGQANSHP